MSSAPNTLRMFTAAVATAAVTLAGAPPAAANPLDVTETLKILAPGPSGTEFGRGVAIDGHVLAAGAPGDDENASNAGAVFVYERAGSSGWALDDKDVAVDPGAAFGTSVTAWGDAVVGGAPLAHGHNTNTGIALGLTERAQGGWAGPFEVFSPDTDRFDRFGTAVSQDGTLLVVGAPEDDDAGANAGSAYVYRRAGTVWTLEAEIRGEDTNAFDYFGTAVAASGDRVVVGAPGDATAGASSGAAYVFRRAAGVWGQEARLVPAVHGIDDRFGQSVALEGSRLAVGSPGREFTSFDQPGAVGVFDLGPAGWEQAAALTPAASANGDAFGWSLALEEGRLYAGARTTRAGHEFVHTEAQWSERRVLRAAGSAVLDMGMSIAAYGQHVVVGSRGAAYFYDLNGTPSALGNFYATDAGVPLVVAAPGVLGNDGDPDGDPLTVAVVTAPTRGALTLAPNGGLTYTPSPGKSGTDWFTYRATDPNGASATAMVVVTVAGPPDAVDDLLATSEDVPATIDVSANDTDPDGDLDRGSVSVQSPPSKGAAVPIGNGRVRYTPSPDRNGADSFTYRICDLAARCDTARVDVAIAAVNDAPVARDDAQATEQYTSVTIAVLANDTDVDGDALLVTAAGPAAHGAVRIEADGRVTYTPGASFKDGDAFTYTIADGRGGTAQATVAIAALSCGEDGLALLDDSAARGALSGTIDREVEPAVGAFDLRAAQAIDEVNCAIVVPLEDAVDEIA